MNLAMRSSRPRWQAGLPGFWGMFTVGTATAIIGPSLPLVMMMYNLSWAEVGVIFSAQFAGKLIAILLLSLWNWRQSSRSVTLAGSLLLGGGLLVTGYSPGWFGTLIGVGILGIGHGAVDAGFNEQFVRTYNQGRNGAVAAGKWLNALHLLFGVGALIGPLLVYELSHGHPWKGPFYVTGVFALLIPVLYLITHRFGPTDATSSDRSVPLQAVDIAPPRMFIWMTVLAALVCFMFGGLETALGGWIYTFLTEGADLSGERATFSVSVFWGLLAVGRLVSVWGVGYFGNSKWLRILSILALAALLAGWFAFDRDSATVMALAGLGLSGIFPTMIAWITGYRPHKSARLISVLITGSTLGAVIVPWAVGEMASYQGLEWSYGLLTAMAAVLLGLVVWLNWSANKLQAQQKI
jgi:FHS family glucose/mannose:H+ symporter-like MFS transporter